MAASGSSALLQRRITYPDVTSCAAAGFRVARLQSFPESDGAGVWDSTSMLFVFLLKGVVVGIVIAVPVGPVGVMCVRRTIIEGRLAGFVSGLGAATADALFGFIAAFGLTFVSDWLIGYQHWLRVAGGFYLLYVGGAALLKRPEAKTHSEPDAESLVRDYISTFALTLTNPITILAFLAIFSAVGLERRGRDARPRGDLGFRRMARLAAVVAGTDLRIEFAFSILRAASSGVDQSRIGHHPRTIRSGAARRFDHRANRLMRSNLTIRRRLHGVSAPRLHRSAAGSADRAHRAARFRTARQPWRTVS